MSTQKVDYNSKEMQMKIQNMGQRVMNDPAIREQFFDDANQFSASKASKNIITYVKAIGSMMKDINDGLYDVGEKWRLYVAVGAAVYAISPIDIIPDVIPVIGWTDDIAIMMMAISIAGSVINEYLDWKEEFDKFEEEYFRFNEHSFDEFYGDTIPRYADGKTHMISDDIVPSGSGSTGLDNALAGLSNLK